MNATRVVSCQDQLHETKHEARTKILWDYFYSNALHIHTHCYTL